MPLTEEGNFLKGLSNIYHFKEPEAHYLAQKNPPLIRILNRLNSVHISNTASVLPVLISSFLSITTHTSAK